MFIIKGPCLPNLLGFSLLVAAIAVIIFYVEQLAIRKNLAGFILYALIALFALAVAHPNTVFTAFIFLGAYGGHVIHKVINTTKRVSEDRRKIVQIAALFIYCAVLIGFWIFCYQLPFLQGVLSYRWSEHSSILYTLATLFSLNMVISGVQWALIVASLVGLIYCLKPARNRIWMLLPVVFFCVCYIVSKSGIDPLKYWLASLWYQTPYRFTAPISVFLMPIAALGINSTLKWADNFVATRWPTKSAALKGHLGAAIMLFLFIGVNFAPGPTIHVDFDGGHDVQTGFAMTERRIANIYRADWEHVYSTEEVAFVDKVLTVIPEGALVINQPNDGSAFAYGVNHLNTYWRHKAGKYNEAAQSIKDNLSQYTTNTEVREALETTGAKYLLQLDQGVAYEDGVWLSQYSKSNYDSWSDIDSIRDNTPGFEVVLAEEDMRLYRLSEL